MDRGFDKGDLYHHLVTGSVQHPRDGRCIAIQHFGNIILPAIRTDVLVEVPFGVHEPHGDQRNPEIAALL